jgi:recombinational DNA repair protein RecR
MSGICHICGNIMQPNDGFCRTCYQNERDEYKIVRNYLRKNPNSNAMQIANATGIPISNILRYIKNGTLTVVTNEKKRRLR